MFVFKLVFFESFISFTSFNEILPTFGLCSFVNSYIDFDSKPTFIVPNSFNKSIVILAASSSNIKLLVTAEFPEEDTGYIEEGFEYCINEGNNLVSYPCDNAIPIAEAIPSSETFLDAIIGEGVAASYLDGVGWVGSLSNLQSGDGYWFQANTNVCFQYECSE